MPIMSGQTRWSEYDYCSNDPVKQLQDKRRGLLSYFTRLCNAIDHCEIEIENADDPDVLDYLGTYDEFECKFREAFDKYCKMHESVLKCQTLDLALVERLKYSHSQAVNRFNDKCQSMRSMMSMLKCRTQRMTKPDLPERKGPLTHDLPECKGPLSHDLPGCKGPLTHNLPDCDLPGNPNTHQDQCPDNDVKTYIVNCKPKSLFKTQETIPKQTVDPVLTSQDNFQVPKTTKKMSATRSSSHVERARLALEKAEIMKAKKMLELDVELARIKLEEAALSRSGSSVSESVKQERTRSWIENQELRQGVTLPDEELPYTTMHPSCMRPEAPEWFPPPIDQQMRTDSPCVPRAPYMPYLPRPSLLSFSGNEIEFTAFQANFMTNIGNQQIPDSAKLGYLLQFCDGVAKEAVKDCVVLPEEEGYTEAWSILREQFGEPHAVARSHLNDLVNGPSVSHDSGALSSLARKMRSCSLALSNMDYSANLNNQETLNKIALRLPKPLRVKWVERANSIFRRTSVQASFHDLRYFIAERAEISASPFALVLHDNSHKSSHSKTTLSTNAEMKKETKQEMKKENKTEEKKEFRLEQKNKSKPPCIICGKNHFLTQCNVFREMSIDERFQEVKKAKLCFNCFQRNHHSTDCPKESFCQEGCKWKHSKWLHRDASKKTNQAKEDAVACHSKDESSSISLQVLQVLVKTDNMVKQVHICIA